MAALRAWVDFEHGLPRQLTMDVALRDVSVRLDRSLEPVAFARFDARVLAERNAGGGSLALQGLRFDAADGARRAPSTLALRWQRRQPEAADTGATAPMDGAGDAPVTGGELSADRLDLAPRAALAERLPLAAGLRVILRQSSPTGTVEQLDARWLSIAAAPAAVAGGVGRPGLRGADLDVSADDGGGQASVAILDGAVELPAVFADASVPLRRLGAHLRWRIDDAAGASRRIALQVERAHFANDDAEGDFHASWESGAGGPLRADRRVGLGALFGQWLLREPLRQASAREFHVTGRWDDPQVQRVQRRLLDPLPAAAPSPRPALTPP